MNLNNDFLKLFVTNGVYTTMEEIQIRIDQILEQMKGMNPDTDEYVNLSGELDELSGKADAIYVMQNNQNYF